MHISGASRVASPTPSSHSRLLFPRSLFAPPSSLPLAKERHLGVLGSVMTPRTPSRRESPGIAGEHGRLANVSEVEEEHDDAPSPTPHLPWGNAAVFERVDVRLDSVHLDPALDRALGQEIY